MKICCHLDGNRVNDGMMSYPHLDRLTLWSLLIWQWHSQDTVNLFLTNCSPCYSLQVKKKTALFQHVDHLSLCAGYIRKLVKDIQIWKACIALMSIGGFSLAEEGTAVGESCLNITDLRVKLSARSDVLNPAESCFLAWTAGFRTLDSSCVLPYWETVHRLSAETHSVSWSCSNHHSLHSKGITALLSTTYSLVLLSSYWILF